MARFPHGLAAGGTQAGRPPGCCPARWVIHVVGPNQARGRDRPGAAAVVLLEGVGGRRRARRLDRRLPLVSAGVYGCWPKDDAIACALEVFRAATTSVVEARIVAFDEPTYELVRLTTSR